MDFPPEDARVDVPLVGATDEEEDGALVAAMCKCHQCTREVAVADCTVTNKSRLSKKVAPIYRCKWCNRVNAALYKDLQVDSQLNALHKAMSSTDKKEWLASTMRRSRMSYPQAISSKTLWRSL